MRATRTGEVLRKMFTYAVSWGWRDDNPASSFRRRIENPRERFLNHEEIRKLAEALDAAEDRRAADIIRLCMLTGARVGEVRQARFEHFNLEHLSWSKPAAVTKQRKIHRLPISDEAAAIVRQRQLLVPRGCVLLFPGDVPGQPVKEIRRFWAAIQKAVGIPDVRIHDLRHYFAIQTMLRWYRTGVNVEAHLAELSTYLGHCHVRDTYWYLSAVPELLQLATERCRGKETLP